MGALRMKIKNEKLKILSCSSEAFTDRVEAGGLLAEALIGHAGPQTVVLGVPRGGVVVAREVASGIPCHSGHPLLHVPRCAVSLADWWHVHHGLRRWPSFATPTSSPHYFPSGGVHRSPLGAV